MAKKKFTRTENNIDCDKRLDLWFLNKSNGEKKFDWFNITATQARRIKYEILEVMFKFEITQIFQLSHSLKNQA